MSAIDFRPGTPRPGPTGEIVLRYPYTVHRFPLADTWTSPNDVRLFISCDYRAPRALDGPTMPRP